MIVDHEAAQDGFLVLHCCVLHFPFHRGCQDDAFLTRLHTGNGEGVPVQRAPREEIYIWEAANVGPLLLQKLSAGHNHHWHELVSGNCFPAKGLQKIVEVEDR